MLVFADPLSLRKTCRDTPTACAPVSSGSALRLDPGVTDREGVETGRVHLDAVHLRRAGLDAVLGHDRDRRDELHEAPLNILVCLAPLIGADLLLRPFREERVKARVGQTGEVRKLDARGVIADAQLVRIEIRACALTVVVL